MRPKLAEQLLCPAAGCGGNITLQADALVTLHYKAGPVEEVREGALFCAECGRAYPISEYVPSFEQLFPTDLQKEALYWSKWYGLMWERGSLGLFDLRAPRAPLIAEGIEELDPSSLGRTDPPGTHSLLADHPLIKKASAVLDIGCGTGWSSLYFARRGHNVTAFDPSSANMRLAKRYAISQGIHIEYLGAALGYLTFKPGTFDAALALHSIHHVPDLSREMQKLNGWLREGGAIAVDEHVSANPTLEALSRELQEWAQREVYPRWRTLDPKELRSHLPREDHSSLEGSGSGELISSILDNFHVDTATSRYVSLDSFSFLYYLSRDLDLRSYYYAGDILDRLYTFFKAVSPDDAEYVTVVATKSPTETSTEAEDKVSRWRAQTSEQESGHRGRAFAEAEVGLLRLQLAQTARELGEVAARAQTWEGDNQTLRADVANLNSSINHLRSDIERLNTMIAQKNSHIEELTGFTKRQQAEIAARDREIAKQSNLLRRIPPPLMRFLDALPKRRKEAK